MRTDRLTGYLASRGLEHAGEYGLRVERLGDRWQRYGFPPEAASEAASALALFIPYRHTNGAVTFERIRLLDDRFGGGKYRQPARRQLALYDPLGVLSCGAPLDAVVLAEGELNALSIIEAEPELSVVGLPGQRALRPDLAERLGHVPIVYVWLDREEQGFERAGAEIDERLRAAGVEDVLFVDAGGADANDILVSPGGADARRRIGRLLDEARPRPGERAGAPLEAIDLAELLEALIAFLRRFVVLSSEAQAVALALWLAHTHALGAADATPYLAVTAPDKGCGKTLLLELLELLAARSWKIDGAPTEAVLFRKLDRDRSTLLLDEVDRLFRGGDERTEPLTAILNAGNRRGATVPRCVGQGTQLDFRDFAVFGAKALAGIDHERWPDTIRDRAVVIALKRCAADERPERFRRRRAEPEASALRERAAAWGETAEERLAALEPEDLEHLSPRAFDGWEPLLAIAELAGAEWPARARAAALALSGRGRVEDGSARTQLLADVRRVFDARRADRLASDELVGALRGLDEAPWGDWRGGGLTPRHLADLLRPYGIRSRSVRLEDGSTPKGYRREQFEDAWKRYLPACAAPERHDATSHTESAVAADCGPPQDACMADGELGADAHGERDVADVADRGPDAGPDGAIDAMLEQAKRFFPGSCELRPKRTGAPAADGHKPAAAAEPPTPGAAATAEGRPVPPCRHRAHRASDWRSIHGAVNCGACHPPAHPSLVAERLEVGGPA